MMRRSGVCEQDVPGRLCGPSQLPGVGGAPDACWQLACRGPEWQPAGGRQQAAAHRRPAARAPGRAGWSLVPGSWAQPPCGRWLVCECSHHRLPAHSGGAQLSERPDQSCAAGPGCHLGGLAGAQPSFTPACGPAAAVGGGGGGEVQARWAMRRTASIATSSLPPAGQHPRSSQLCEARRSPALSCVQRLCRQVTSDSRRSASSSAASGAMAAVTRPGRNWTQMPRRSRRGGLKGGARCGTRRAGHTHTPCAKGGVRPCSRGVHGGRGSRAHASCHSRPAYNSCRAPPCLWWRPLPLTPRRACQD
jgi:hypothetical protein